ncbi:SET domain-containing protein 4 [Gracilariopsis chorda]|uniref:SET domain-containing protein 4 n=1 Tax=Gracilariopsis chorda TaxID=448386 RepID=A0A2V3J2D7_9FLOR|nr:SET domain-containing protein 4 [Gracilariopsis chorda]|eukprot:PXF48558.1 SET domain-containing protein 4 [Gracilariopsis chorda]
MSWCRDVGIVCPALTIRVENGQRGLFATRNITPGEDLICIPRKACLISAATDTEAPPMEVLHGLSRTFWSDAPWHLRLSVLLIDQQLAGATSKFHAYVSALPADPTCVLWAYETYGRTSVIPSLSRYHMDMPADLYHKLIKSRYQRFRRALPKHLQHSMSLKNFCWSLSNVASRAFAIPPPQLSSCNTLQFALLPMLDMANASTHAPTRIRFDRENQMIRVATGASYRAGDQVYVSYGSKSNDDFMFFYGFVEGDNPANSVTITDFREWVLRLAYRVSPVCDSWDRKLKVLRDAGVLHPDKTFSFSMDKLDESLLFVLRITLATPCQLETYQEETKRSSSKKFITIDLGNELAVWQAVREKCEALLRELPPFTAEEHNTLGRILGRCPCTAAWDFTRPQSEGEVLYRYERGRVLRGTIERVAHFAQVSKSVGRICTVLLPPSQQLLRAEHFHFAQKETGTADIRMFEISPQNIEEFLSE